MERLAVYGSLAPGRVNHHVLEHVEGSWRQGRVEGRLHECGWGATMGYPAMTHEVGCGSWVEVWVLESTSIRWDSLDDFEGAEYERVCVDVHGIAADPVRAWIYALRRRH